MSEQEHPVVAALPDQRFATTHWSVVLAAQDPGSPDAAEALETLCQTYWGTIYVYARHRGHSPDDAADLTQGFFAHFLDRHLVDHADRNRGGFRSFLLRTFNHFQVDEWRRAHAEKRGGAHPVLSINADEFEAKYGRELSTDLTPEKVFERRWAIALFDRALTRLDEECVAAGKARQFDLLKEFLSSASSKGAYAAAAGQLGLPLEAVAVQVHRLRRRYGKLVREEVAHTVAGPEDVDEELHHLLDVLSG
jgi:RNA polymerase sigma-70 factor (ECF subfamily)